jgi:hypothetical protein
MGMATMATLCGAVLFGFGMFLWGTLTGEKTQAGRVDRAYTDGFRDGWEACEQFDDDVNVIWGGNR